MVSKLIIFTDFVYLLFLATISNKFVLGEYNCEYKKDGFYSDEDFCHIYWRCNYGVAEEYECPAGTAWNHLESRCDWLDNVDCSRMDGKKEATVPDDDDENIETTKKIRSDKKKPPKSTTALPDSDTTHEIEIPNFDTEIESDNKPKGPKNSFATTAINIGNSNGANCQSFGSYFVQDPANCASYYMCNNGKETKMTCQDKQLFNAETTQCEDFQQVFCGSRAVNLAEKNQCLSKRDGIYPDVERSCKVFYQCINQQKVREANCPNQLKFNSLTGRCDNPNNIISPCGTYSTSMSTTIYPSIVCLIHLIVFALVKTN